jgi:hypothetical protein
VTITRQIGDRRDPAYRVAETDWSYDERGLEALSDIGNVKKIIFNDPATIILWNDGSKTVVKAHNEPFDPEKGVAMCFMKKACDNKASFNNVFKKWIPEEEVEFETYAKTELDTYEGAARAFSDTLGAAAVELGRDIVECLKKHKFIRKEPQE